MGFLKQLKSKALPCTHLGPCSPQHHFQVFKFGQHSPLCIYSIQQWEQFEHSLINRDAKVCQHCFVMYVDAFLSVNRCIFAYSYRSYCYPNYATCIFNKTSTDIWQERTEININQAILFFDFRIQKRCRWRNARSILNQV